MEKSSMFFIDTENTFAVAFAAVSVAAACKIFIRTMNGLT
jgi:hypothetical protein